MSIANLLRHQTRISSFVIISSIDIPNHKFPTFSSIFHHQQRTARFRPKKIFFPTMKKVPRPAHKKKEHEFSDDTLYSLSHGDDWLTKIRTSEYEKKHLYRSHPERYIQRIWSDILDHFLWLPISKSAMHKMHQAGSFDRYILSTPPKQLNSRLGERLRYRLLRVLEKREDMILERAVNGDESALPIAYRIVLKQERDERNALRRRNNWLKQREGKRESNKRQWMRSELNERILLIQNGKLPQKIHQLPLWEQVQSVVNDEELQRKRNLNKLFNIEQTNA